MNALRDRDAHVLADILAAPTSQEKVDRLNQLDPAGRDRLLALALMLLDDVADRKIKLLHQLAEVDRLDELWHQPTTEEES